MVPDVEVGREEEVVAPNMTAQEGKVKVSDLL